MKKSIVLVIVFFLSCAQSAFPQTNESNAERARIETMFQSLAPGQIELAIDAFAKDSLIPSEWVNQATSSAKAVLTPDRPILGYEFLQEQNTGESMKRLTYILKLNDRPLFWSFSFYRPTNDWVPLRIYLFEEP